MRKQEVICDRCKKKIKIKFRTFEYTSAEIINDVKIMQVTNELDLCPNCYEDIIDYIYNK